MAAPRSPARTAPTASWLERAATTSPAARAAIPLFGGAGADTFEFVSGDGRDVIRKFDVTEDVLHIGVITGSMDDVKIGSFHGEANTIITFTGDTGASNKIILLGVTADSVTEGSFIF